MINKFTELTEKQKNQKIYQFSSDCFFHYLLHHSDKVRLYLCRYLSGDDNVKSTKIINNEIYGKNVNSKTLILDVTMRDNLGQYYNLEMQNYDFDKGEEIRMMRYLEGLIQRQIKKSDNYELIKKVFQMIIYAGKPIGEFQDYVHEIQKGDIERQLYYPGEMGKTTLIQLSKLKEKTNMELQQTTMNRLMRLFYDNEIEELEESDEIIEEVIELHNEYIEDEEELLTALRLERDRMTYNTRLYHAKNEGIEEGIEEGKRKELIENVRNLISKIYHTNETEWLNDCTYKQLKEALSIVLDGLSYEEYINQIKKYS